MVKFFSLFKEIGITGCIDIVFMSLILYGVLIWFKKTKAAFVLTGIIITAGVYLLAREFDLLLTVSILQGFFAVILIVLVVIFQEDLKHFFEQVAMWSLNRNRKRRKSPRLSRTEGEILVRTLNDLAREKIGALIVIQGKDLIMRHLEGGIDLDGKLSEPLLKSIFDPHSDGHDGAVVIEQDQITQFSCQLPLSKDFKTLGQTGTRHAAALGLAELTDALCLVVSEERGTISVARNGTLQTVHDPQTLSTILEAFYREVNPKPEYKLGQEFLRKNSREKLIALSLAIALWFVLAYGSKEVYKTYTVPIDYSAVSPEFTVEKISPEEIEVSFSGPRRAFYFFNQKKATVFLKLWKLKGGSHRIRISPADLSFPKGLAVESIEPSVVWVSLEKVPAPEKKPDKITLKIPFASHEKL